MTGLTVNWAYGFFYFVVFTQANSRSIIAGSFLRVLNKVLDQTTYLLSSFFMFTVYCCT